MISKYENHKKTITRQTKRKPKNISVCFQEKKRKTFAFMQKRKINFA